MEPRLGLVQEYARSQAAFWVEPRRHQFQFEGAWRLAGRYDATSFGCQIAFDGCGKFTCRDCDGPRFRTEDADEVIAWMRSKQTGTIDVEKLLLYRVLRTGEPSEIEEIGRDLGVSEDQMRTAVEAWREHYRNGPGQRWFDTFGQSRWTMVRRLTFTEEEERVQQQLLKELCEAYAPPVYAFFRSRNHSPSEAEALAEDLFAEILSRRDRIASARDHGGFRAYLFACAESYLDGEHQTCDQARENTSTILPPLDEIEERYQEALEDRLTPEQVFDWHWIVTMLDRTLAAWAKRGVEGRRELCRIIRRHRFDGISHAEIAQRLEVEERMVRVWMGQLRSQCRRGVLGEIRDTLVGNADCEGELQALGESVQLCSDE